MSPTKKTKHTKQTILAILEEHYLGFKSGLNYSCEFEMLIAVILSAQCTDERVNIVTARLFPEFNTPAKLMSLGRECLEEYIRECGLFRSKTKNILATCEILCLQYNEKIPQTYSELIKLPGVGRKTANVLISQLFSTPAIAVDTHVFRVANRLGLAEGDTPLKVEQGLMKVIPRRKWKDAHHWLIWHGRKVCRALKPLCSACPLANLCLYANKADNV